MTYYRRKRRETGMSQIDVANYLGIDYKKYLLIERGKIKMPTKLIDKFNELINKSKGERDIDRLNREQLVNKWFEEMSVKTGYGKYNLNKKLEEFNIDNFLTLSRLLGYKNQSTITHMLTHPEKATFNTKNLLYSFFENELNIQEPNEQIKKKEHIAKQKNVMDNIKTWYKTFNITDWLNSNNLKLSEFAVGCGVCQNTIRNAINGKKTSATVVKKIYNFVKEYENTSKHTNIVVKKQESNIKERGNDDMIFLLIKKYEKVLTDIDTELSETENYIKELENMIAEKSKRIEALYIKQSIYEDLLNTLKE